MSTIKIAICEDNAAELNQLMSIIEECKLETECRLFSNGKDFLEDFHIGLYDLIFMDIYMTGTSGIDVISEVRRQDTNVTVAFTTSSLDHALDGYRLNVIKYIEKPVTKKDILETLHLAMLQKQEAKCVHIRINGKECDIPQSHICYVEQRIHTLYLFMTSSEILKFTGKLDKIQSAFPSPPFFRCHKSYLVNLSHVKWLNKELMVFEMDEWENVHIRRESLKAAVSTFENYIFHETRRLGDE